MATHSIGDAICIAQYLDLVALMFADDNCMAEFTVGDIHDPVVGVFVYTDDCEMFLSDDCRKGTKSRRCKMNTSLLWS
ncbi:MAG: hypothetical protein IKC93_04115 [Candidatus Methanomethylophilaceae archaeon]|nr:hypothetical protein [Candidatus Methanomethylophilaceae archaeon]